MSIVRATRELWLGGIGALVVMRDGQHVEGVLSERDIVHGLARHGAAVVDLRVGDLMTRAARTCAPDDTVQHVMAEMTRARVRHLPVLEAGRLCGIVSIGDVVKNRLEDAEMEVHVLRDAYIAHR